MIDKNYILNNTDIESIIEKETGQTLEKVGSNLRLPVCPFCGSGNGPNKTPAFTVNQDQKIWKCFACDRGGDVIRFIQELHRFSFNDAINYIAKNYLGIEPKNENKNFTEWDKKLYAIKLNPKTKAINYLQDVRKIKTSYLPYDAFYYDKLSDAVVFLDSEQKIINKRFIAPKKGQSKSIIIKCCDNETLHNKIYDITYNKEQDTVYITEGVINALSLYPRSALAIFTTSNKFTDVKKLTKYLENKDVVLAFDPDAAGQKTTKYYFNFIKQNIKVKSISTLLFPEGKDINDLLKEKLLYSFLNNYDNYDFRLIDIRRKPLPFNTKDIEQFEQYNGFFIKNSVYAYKKKTNSLTYEIVISDCIWEYLYRIIDSQGNATHLIKIQRYDNENRRLILKLVEADTSQIQKSEFEKLLNNYGFNYWGPTTIYNRIKTYNLHHEKEVEKIERYGYHPDKQMFFWSNLAMDINGKIYKPNELGIIETGKNAYYLETASPANATNPQLAEFRKFEFRQSAIDIKQFTKLFYDAYKENALIGLSYYVASLHRDIIFQEMMRFPNLYLYGPANTGKSSFVEILAALQGDYTGGYSVNNSSTVAFNRLVNTRRNSFIYLKEYSTEKNTANIDEFIKTAYEGIGRTIGIKSTDNKVISYEALTGIIIDSNFLPINQEAVFSRMIFLDFIHGTFSQKQIKAFNELKAFQKKGLAHLNIDFLKLRNTIAKDFPAIFNNIYSKLKEKFSSYSDRLLIHTAMILAVFNIIAPLTEMGNKKQQLWQAMQEIMFRHTERLETFRHTRIFWEAVALAIKKDLIKNIDNEDIIFKNRLYYRIIKDRRIFAFKSSDFKEYNLLYQRYSKDINITPLPDKQLKEQLMSADYYLKPTNGRRLHQDKIFGTTALYFQFNPINDTIITIDNVTIELN